jgi:nitrile hydratase accessory protein
MTAIPHQLAALPIAPPGDDEGPVFAEPWQAQVFAMTLQLQEEGRFTWPEWVEVFSAEIAGASGRGDPDLGDTYYHHWLAALETIVASKQLMSEEERRQRQKAWAEAAAATPHGEPIVLRDSS